MEAPKFDFRGFLQPSGKIELNLEEFESIFVSAFPESAKRKELFKGLIRYNQELRKVISSPIRQWINGSFVTKTMKPRDIDVVTLISFNEIEGREIHIRDHFLGSKPLKEYGIDAFIIKVYPENHKFRVYTTSDMGYWEDWFSKSKMNRRRQRFNKGFVEIFS